MHGTRCFEWLCDLPLAYSTVDVDDFFTGFAINCDGAMDVARILFTRSDSVIIADSTIRQHCRWRNGHEANREMKKKKQKMKIRPSKHN